MQKRAPLNWQDYGNLHGDSGVAAYALGDHWIAVRFLTGDAYLYDADAPGRTHVAEMQRLAIGGRGLSTYISRHIGARYAAKLP